jgi:hypothetical protein
MDHLPPFAVAGLLFVALLPASMSASAEERRLSCESSGGKYKYCAARTQGRAELVEQTSGAPCVEGRSWGYDAGGVWVRDGCRGMFSVGREHRPPPDRIVCESHDGRTQRCPVRTENQVRLVNQLGRAPCIEGRTWGYDWNEIWVDDRCRGEFVVGAAAGGGRGGPPPGDGYPGDRGGPPPGGPPRDVFTCESPGGRHQRCDMRVHGDVELVRQLSDAPCVEGRSWGFDRNGVWVDDGCRGEFVIRHRR